MSDSDEAKKMFFHYGGSYFHMIRDNVFDDYKKFNISEDTEKKWFIEMFHEDMALLQKKVNPEEMVAEFYAVSDEIISLNEWPYIIFLKEFISSRFGTVDDFVKLCLVESLIRVAKKADPETLLHTAKYSLPLLQAINPAEIDKTNPILLPFDDSYTTEERVKSIIEECMAIISAESPTKNNPCEDKHLLHNKCGIKYLGKWLQQHPLVLWVIQLFSNRPK